MGGSGHIQPVKLDPGIESWNYMRENVWKSFRFTNRTARLSLVWGVLVPVGVFALCQREDLKWDILGAKKDQPLARFGPSSQPKPAPVEDDE